MLITLHLQSKLQMSCVPRCPKRCCCVAGAPLVPSSIFLNGEKCILVNVGGQALGLGTSGTAGQESAEQPLSLSGPNIIGTDGNVVNFQGVNWFGFEVPTVMTSMHIELGTVVS